MRKNLIITTLSVTLLIFSTIYWLENRNNNVDTINPIKGIDLNVEGHKPKSESQVYFETYPRIALKNIWIQYADKIQGDGRTIDRDRDYLTTSEGQSYSLLRAVWMDDKHTFDKVLKWTNNNLRKRPDDKLFAWKWGQNEEGNWDVLYDEGGINTASDADQDIALALIFAAKRWDEEDYLDQAIEILNDIWEVEVIMIDGRPYLTSGNWAKNEEYPTINPSYYSFAAYDIFHEVNPEHPWDQLKDTSYELLEKSTYGNLDKESSVNLPPDWFNIDPETGEIVENIHEDKVTDFSDDAIRVFWRVALDWYWNNDVRASEYLISSSDYLKQEWEENNKIFSEYTHDGEPIVDYESYSLYASYVPALKIINSETANDLYYSKITPLYDVDYEAFSENSDLGYYSQNWVWFGIALYEGLIPDLYKEIK